MYVYNTSSKTKKQISKPEHQIQTPISWSKDSQRMLYSALVGFDFKWNEKTQRKEYAGAMHIFLANINGQNQRLTKGKHMHNRPAFSPDEKQIAYLYSGTLNDTVATLKIMSTTGEVEKTLYTPVLGNSNLKWY